MNMNRRGDPQRVKPPQKSEGGARNKMERAELVLSVTLLQVGFSWQARTRVGRGWGRRGTGDIGE